MASRSWTAEEILEAVLEDEDFDDPDEPMMEGSDEEFSELEEEDDEEDSDDEDPTPSLCSSISSVLSSPGTATLPTSWSSSLMPLNIKDFTSSVGPTVAIPASPLEAFKLFFTTDLLERIVEESNRYARQVMGDERYDQWNKMTLEDLKAYLGFIILMAINHLPGLEDYWKRDPFLHYSPVADRISRDRFRELSRFLHFADNDTLQPRGSPEYDRLGKVRPLITYLSEKFASIYHPHREVAVDEAMIKFQGRSSLKQYLPLKPIKRGKKVWVLGDSYNGYFCKFEVYTGKQSNSPEKGLGQRVVKSLTTDLQGKNHHVFFDNFFTCEQLLADLEKDGIYACATARRDRKGFPPALKKVKLDTR